MIFRKLNELQPVEHLDGMAAGPIVIADFRFDDGFTHRRRGLRIESFLPEQPIGNALKVATVQWLFKQYADTDTGLRNLTDQLIARGVPGPTGGPWYAASIKAILENQNYTGTFTWAKRREGKFHSVSAGQVRKRDRGEVTLSPAGKSHAIDNPREAWIVVEDAHEALIDRELFERVQAKIVERRRSTPGASYRTHTKGNGDAYLLSGLVFCARCGCKMHGSTLKAKGHSYPKYTCSTYWPERQEQSARLRLPRRPAGPIGRRGRPQAAGVGADRTQPGASANGPPETDRAASSQRIQGIGRRDEATS